MQGRFCTDLGFVLSTAFVLVFLVVSGNIGNRGICRVCAVRNGVRLPWWDAGEFLRRRVKLRAERDEDRVYLREMSSAIMEDAVLYIR